MSRYIDADALVERLKHSPLFLGTNMQFKDGVVDLVEKQPTADVVEVVRCKDCKHYGGVVYGGVCRKYSGYETKVCTDKDHYCSYGERDKSCDTCAFYNEDRDNQPCCYCAENSCWEKGEEDDT